MKYFLFIVVLMGILFTAGCIREFSTTDQTNPSTGTRYVNEVTPFSTITPERITYRTLSPVTQVPEDLTCLIYSTKQSFSYNKKALSFNLVNPPMYINYSVSDVPYITKTKLDTSQNDPNSEKMITYKTINPASFFEIIVRDKSTGEIYLQDGFGKDYGYKEGTLKLNKRADLLLEMTGNMITADVKLWVKPIGNINDTAKFNYEDCIYWN